MYTYVYYENKYLRCYEEKKRDVEKNMENAIDKRINIPKYVKSIIARYICIM